MNKPIVYSLCLLVLCYFLLVFLYPIANDEAIFSVIGKNLDSAKLYHELPDNKPPGIHFTMYLFSLIPFSQFIVNRLVIFLITLASAYLIINISRQLFNPKKEFLILIPIFYILFSILYLSGLVPLVETFESFFVLLSLTLFLKSRNQDYAILPLFLSSLFLFVAFQYKPTAIFFFLIPVLTLIFDKKTKQLSLFLLSFLIFLILFTLIIYNFNLINDYINYAWLYNFNKVKAAVPFTQKILPILFSAPLLILSFLGISSALKDNKKQTLSILIPNLLVLFSSLVLINSSTFRFYFLEVTPLFCIFIPITFQYFNNTHLLKKIIVGLSVLFLILFFFFVLFRVFSGFNSPTVFSDVALISSILPDYGCSDYFATVNYWYISGEESEYIQYSLNGMGFNYSGITEDLFKKHLTTNGTCFVSIRPYSFYSFQQTLSPTKDPLFDIADDFCSCDSFDQKTTLSTICYNCTLATN